MSSLSYRDHYINHARDLPETKARLRRLRLFEVITGLREIQRQFEYLRLIPRRNLDHVSYWTDGQHDYLLSEIYDFSPVEQVRDLVVIELPPEIAPYGGGWSNDSDAQPHSRSLLFASSENAFVLESIHLRMMGEARMAPRWNALEVE